MDHEELVTLAVLCSAWISDMTNVLRHPDQNPTDKAVNLVARIEANRTPSLVYEEPWVKANAGRITHQWHQVPRALHRRTSLPNPPVRAHRPQRGPQEGCSTQEVPRVRRERLRHDHRLCLLRPQDHRARPP
jgi:hypothetical protein